MEVTQTCMFGTPQKCDLKGILCKVFFITFEATFYLFNSPKPACLLGSVGLSWAKLGFVVCVEEVLCVGGIVTLFRAPDG